MSDNQLAFKSVAQLAPMIQSRELSPLELVEVYLERIDRLDKKLGAFITVCRDQALETAKQAEKDIRAGNYIGPLHGIPISIKDQFDTEGVRTTLGSRIFSDNIPDRDATIVTRLKQSGAVLLGKLNLTEFAFGDTRFYPYGIPRNPWNPDMIPGGSSSGSGIAVAASLSAATIGEDTGGSVRLPAAMCGVTGIRPTFGRVSRYGSFPMSWSMDIAGPLTKTVEDCALVLGAISGHDPKDPLSSRKPVPDYTAHLRDGIGGMRVGYLVEHVEAEGIDEEIKHGVKKAISVFEELGARVAPISVPLVSKAGAIFIGTCDTDAAGAHEELLRTRAKDYDPATRTRLFASSLLPSTLYHRAQRARELLRRQMNDAFKKVDVILSPTIPTPPIHVDEAAKPFVDAEDVRARLFGDRSLSAPYSLAGLPALTVPCGFNSAGLPMGLQIGGRAFEEATIMRAGAAYESITEWHTRRPNI